MNKQNMRFWLSENPHSHEEVTPLCNAPCSVTVPEAIEK
jgi:hypothetical protein